MNITLQKTLELLAFKYAYVDTELLYKEGWLGLAIAVGTDKGRPERFQLAGRLNLYTLKEVLLQTHPRFQPIYYYLVIDPRKGESRHHYKIHGSLQKLVLEILSLKVNTYFPVNIGKKPGLCLSHSTNQPFINFGSLSGHELVNLNKDLIKVEAYYKKHSLCN